MGLGTFKAPTGNFIKSTPFDAAANVGKPLVVIVHDFKEDFKTEAFPNERPVAFVMIADLSPVLSGGQAILYPNAILGGDAVADRLRQYAKAETEEGEPLKLPVKLGTKPSKQGGRKYRTIEPLSGAELALAEAWDSANPTALQDERARLQAEADAAAEAEQAKPQSNGKAPAAGTDDDAIAKAIAALSGKK